MLSSSVFVHTESRSKTPTLPESAKHHRRSCTPSLPFTPSFEGSLTGSTPLPFTPDVSLLPAQRPRITAHFLLSPLECADPQNAPITPLECAVSKTKDLKSFRMRRFAKSRGVGRHFPAEAQPNCRITYLSRGRASTVLLEPARRFARLFTGHNSVVSDCVGGFDG